MNDLTYSIYEFTTFFFPLINLFYVFPLKVVIVGATNRPDMLDDAALRRLTKRAFVPLPDTESRAAQIKALLAKHLDSNSMLSDQEIHTVSSGLEGWNGSDVKALCAKAADFSYDETVENYGGIQNVPDRFVCAVWSNSATMC